MFFTASIDVWARIKKYVSHVYLIDYNILQNKRNLRDRYSCASFLVSVKTDSYYRIKIKIRIPDGDR